MAVTRVWNISDDPTTKVPAMNIVVLGKNLAPGQFVQVDEEALKSAHKLRREAAKKLVFIGMELPAHYRRFKSPAAAKAVAGAIRTHDELGAVKDAAPAAVEAKLSEEKPAEPEKPAEEKPVEEKTESEEGGRRGKRRNWGG